MSDLIEQPFWQEEWHGIRFSTLPTSTSFRALASSKFYTAYYDAFFAKFSAFSELDVGWRGTKQATAAKLAELLPPDSRVLSYGCGIGYIEYVLSQSRTDLQLSGFDFSERWADLLKKEEQSILQVSNLTASKYDVIYLVQVLYALPFAEGAALLMALKSNLREGGRIILANTSASPVENEALTDDKPNRLARLRDLVRPIHYQVLSLLGRNNKQFWGWHRNNASYAKMLRDAGFEIDSISSSAQQSFIVAHPN